MFLGGVFRLLVLPVVASMAANAAPSTTRPSNSDNRLAARSTSTQATWDGCQYNVPNAGSFNSHFSFDFTTLDTLPDEFIASTYEVGSGPYAPYAHIFNPDNIVLTTGEPMQMIVPGGQTADPLDTCQLVTRYDDVLYASVRTVAQVSPVNGTVHGFFMYMNDTQETDIEIRTGDPGHIHFTNQQTHSGNGETTYAIAAPSDMTSAFHEYRYDWLPTGTNYYIDGELVLSINRNVPSEPGWLMWNNWANGYAWTYGPPLQDNILLIQSVEAHFNRTSVDTTTCEASVVASSSSASTATTSVATTSAAAVTSAATSSAGAVVTTNAAAVTNYVSSAAAVQSSDTDAGTSTIVETQSSTTPSINTSETLESSTSEISSTNTAQITNTIGIALDPTSSAVETSVAASSTGTAYANGSTPVIAGVAFSVQTDTSYSGTLLDLLSIRSSATVEDCLQMCAASPACVGTAFDSDSSTCSYFSSFDKDSKTTNWGVTFAAVQDRETNSSTTVESATSSEDSANASNTETASKLSADSTTESASYPTTTVDTSILPSSPATTNTQAMAEPSSAISSSVEATSIIQTTISPTTSAITTASTTPPATSPSSTIILSISLSTSTTTPTTSTSTLTPTPTTSIACPTSNNTLYTDPASNKTFSIECGIDHAGGDLSMVYVSDLASCIAACAESSACVDVSLSGAACYLKGSVGVVVDSSGILGARLLTSGTNVATSTSSTTNSSASSSAAATAAYTMAAFQQLLQLHIDARLVVPSS